MCARNSTPLLAEVGMAVPGGNATAQRKDGSLQVSYMGKPLYLRMMDEAPGDRTGDGFNVFWHIGRP
ncbi:hypothetical protein [Pseudoruegeria sp. HB172150]|uniref:hypothetical protein n=1 Tax=Pseudoruegeria sp. HB172150 TaxID=2721164 RepID=UPI001C132581|nr:hypothetical protein [Pseudoruegeria sp. HB172150]